MKQFDRENRKIIHRLHWSMVIVMLGLALSSTLAGIYFLSYYKIECQRVKLGSEIQCLVQGKQNFQFREEKVFLGKITPKLSQTETEIPFYTLQLGKTSLGLGISSDQATRIHRSITGFFQDSSILQWKEFYFDWYLTVMLCAIGIFILILIVFFDRKTTISWDSSGLKILIREKGIFLRKDFAIPLSEIQSARMQAPTDFDSNIYDLQFQRKDGVSVAVSGMETHIAQTVSWINGILANSYSRISDMPSTLQDELDRNPFSGPKSGPYSSDPDNRNPSHLFDGWDDLEDKQKWSRMELFLSGIAIDNSKIVKNRNEECIEARGTLSGFPIRIKFSALAPGGLEIEYKVPCRLGWVDLEYDPQATAENEGEFDPEWDNEKNQKTFFSEHVFATDNRSAEGFRQFPTDLARRICSVIEKEKIRYFRMRPEITELDGQDDITEIRNPQKHLSTVLKILAECGNYLKTIDEEFSQTSSDDNDWDEDEPKDELK